MNEYEQEPATQPLNTKPEAETNSSVKPPKRPRSRGWKIVSGLLLVLLIFTAVVAAGLWYKYDQIDKTASANGQDAVELRTANLKLKSENEKLTSRLEGLESAARLGAGNDEDQIKSAAQQLNASLAEPLVGSTIEVVKKDKSQAVATLTTSDKTYRVYLKQVNGRWNPVWIGSSDIDATNRQLYGLTI